MAKQLDKSFTSIQSDTSMNATAFASTFYFFSTHNANAEKNKKSLQANAPDSAVFARTSNSGAMNVNRLEQGVSELQTVVHRTNSRAADNIRLKEIKKRRALIGKQRVELLTNSVGKRTVVLLIPSFFYFFNPFFVSSKHKDDN